MFQGRADNMASDGDNPWLGITGGSLQQTLYYEGWVLMSRFLLIVAPHFMSIQCTNDLIESSIDVSKLWLYFKGIVRIEGHGECKNNKI